MNRKLFVLTALSLLVAGAAGATSSGFWQRPAACGAYICSVATFADGDGVAPTGLQPDGGVIGKNVNPDGGVLPATVGLSGSGLALTTIRGFSVTVGSTNGSSTMTAGTLKAYLQSPVSTTWSRAADLDLTVPAVQSAAFTGFLVTMPAGRIAYIPSGLGVAVTVTLVGTN